MDIVSDGTARSRQLTWPVEQNALAGWGSASGGATFAWPCWSPDARFIACFVEQAEASPTTHVAVMEVDGVHEHRLQPLIDRMPVHLQWSPDGSRVAVLVQYEDLLELWVADVSPRPTELRLVAEGSPLFFGWACGGRRIVLHVGDEASDSARVEVRDVAGDSDDIVFRLPPSNFCVPFSVERDGEERILYVIRRHDQSQLVSAGLDGEDVVGLAVLPGLVALVPTPDGQRVAFASAPDADGSPYAGIQGVSTDGVGHPVAHTDEPVLAFFWRPAGARAMWVRWDTGRQSIRWFVQLETGETREVGRFRPTRDQYFYLHFFEQFARSHSSVSADDRWLVWAGHPTDDSSAGPAVFLTDLGDPSAEPTAVCAGTYAVFAPR